MNPRNLPETFYIMEGTEQEVSDALGIPARRPPSMLRREPRGGEWDLVPAGEAPELLVAPEGPVRVQLMRLVWREPHQMGPE